jgi:hypothetical protein
MANREINNNGHPYVDLGLPSGTLWSICNVGADKPTDCGLYFQWGDTVGYTNEQIGKDKQFTWKDYKFRINKSSSNTNEQIGKDTQFNLSDSKPIITEGASKFNKYRERGATLELEDDAAHINMGGDWHMPTNEQILELFDNTTSEWETLDEVNGRLFISKSDTSKSIFIPAAGYAEDGLVYNIGKIGYVWSSMLSSKYVNYGMSLSFFVSHAYLTYYYRYLGFPVRGVIG